MQVRSKLSRAGSRQGHFWSCTLTKDLVEAPAVATASCNNTLQAVAGLDMAVVMQAS